MSRSRNIKPGFFTNDVLAECDPLARILFAGLWIEADREGRLEDRPRKLKASILGYDNCDCDELLGQLSSRGFIVRYKHGDAQYIQIVNFHKHQDPHYKERASQIPPPDGHIDSGKTAGAPTEDLRSKIIERDGRCLQCGSTEDLTLDHIVPRSKGGSHSEENLQTLCRRCNASKNNRNARSMIDQSSSDDQGGKSPLIPDSGFLIPDSSDVPTEHKARSRKSASRATLSVADLIADGVEEDHARDWLKARGKVPLTQTAWDAVKREAERAHIPHSQAVRIAAENGWRGFKADWANNGHNGSKPSKPAWLADREARMAEFTGKSKEIIDAATRRLD